MKVINFGSLNIDLVYHVHEFARPGETITLGHHTNIHIPSLNLLTQSTIAQMGKNEFLDRNI